jgi:type I restriction enzyme S subunit
MPDIAKLAMAVPPLDEQADIVKFLDCETARLALLISTAEKATELLSERRAALIAAAVTGQIDVRDACPPR